MRLSFKCRFCLFTGLIFFYTVVVQAQVPVRQEPRHHPVFQNKYIRLLDVWLPPGDTTLFHIHDTPSVFVVLTNTLTGSQEKGEGWTNGMSVAGTSWYRSFTPVILVHRVCNLDTVTYHVNDIELLSYYDSGKVSTRKALPFKLLFESERAVAWQIADAGINGKAIRDRGPMIVELVSGKEIIFHDAVTGRSKTINTGQYLYIDPGTSFYFTGADAAGLNMIIFEIK